MQPQLAGRSVRANGEPVKGAWRADGDRQVAERLRKGPGGCALTSRASRRSSTSVSCNANSEWYTRHMTNQVAVRLPAEQIRAIDDLVQQGHGSRSEVIRRALELYLYRLDCERDAERYDEQPLSEVELSLTDDERGWSATPTW